MKDPELVEKRLAHVVTCVEQLRRLARPDALAADPVQRAFVEHTLQTAIQSMLDVASAIVSDERLGEPRTNHELFDLLAQGGWIPAGTVQTYRRITGFRNVVVHRYLDVDLDLLRGILASHLEDLLGFVRLIRDRRGG